MPMIDEVVPLAGQQAQWALVASWLGATCRTRPSTPSSLAALMKPAYGTAEESARGSGVFARPDHVADAQLRAVRSRWRPKPGAQSSREQP